jgi:diacylglycerol kinase (ATP)
MRRRFFLIDNPGAGYGSRKLVGEVISSLRSRGCEVISAPPSGPAAAFEAAGAAARCGSYDAIVAAGGDGTIRLAAKALIGTGVPLGVIPLGTGNVLAHEVGLARQPVSIADVLATGTARPVQVSTANGEPFLLMAGIGFDGAVVAGLDHRTKARLGKLAYVAPVTRAMLRPPPELELDLDGRTFTASWAVISNARCYGGRFVIAEAGDVEAPGLTAILIQSPGRATLARVLLALATGRLSRSSCVVAVPCRRARIQASLPVPVQIDGDPHGSTPVDIVAGTATLLMILPPKAAREA